MPNTPTKRNLVWGFFYFVIFELQVYCAVRLGKFGPEVINMLNNTTKYHTNKERCDNCRFNHNDLCIPYSIQLMSLDSDNKNFIDWDKRPTLSSKIKCVLFLLYSILSYILFILLSPLILLINIISGGMLY